MKEGLKILQFDLKSSWKWHLFGFAVMLGLIYAVLRYGAHESFEDYFTEPLLSVDVVYLLAFSGTFMTFVYTPPFMPKRRQLADHYIPMLDYVKQLPISLSGFAHYYFIKYVIMQLIFMLVIASLLYSTWQPYLSFSEYLAFVIFWLGVGLILGFWSLSLYPYKNMILMIVLSTIVLIVFMILGIFFFYKLTPDGLVGLIVNLIKKNQILLPIMSLILALVSYKLAHKQFVSFMERRRRI